MNSNIRRITIRAAMVAALALPLLAGGQDAGEVEPPARHVSLVAVLANPDAFDGREITLVGYVSIGFKDEAIWLMPGDRENAVFENSIEITQKITSLSADGYAEVKGVFHKKKYQQEAGVGEIEPKYVKPWPHAKAAQPAPPPQRGCSWFL